MKSTAESMQEIEAKKRQLEEHVSTVNENLLEYTQNISLYILYKMKFKLEYLLFRLIL